MKAPCLKFGRDDFFIRIRGYGKNDEWVKCVKQTAEESVNLIRENKPFEEVVKHIAEGVRKANRYPLDVWKRAHSSILRTPREGWRYGSEWTGYSLKTSYGKGGHLKYNSYEEKLNETIKNQSKIRLKI